MKKFLILNLVLFVFFTNTASAVFTEIGENLIVDEKKQDDLYLLAEQARLDSDVDGDLYIITGDVTIYGNVAEDVAIIGGTVKIAGKVFGDVRILSGEVDIDGEVGDDLLVSGGQVTIGKNANINGTLIANSGKLILDGNVKEDLKGRLGDFILNGKIDGDVDLAVGDILFGNTAKIAGNLKYKSRKQIDIPAGVVGGTTEFLKYKKESFKDVSGVVFTILGFSFLAALLVLLIMVIFYPKVIVNSGVEARKNFLKTLGIGILTVFGGILAAFILMFTLVGIPLALIIIAGLLLANYFAKFFAAAIIASYFYKYKNSDSRLKVFGALMLGLLVYYLLGLIPFVGWFLIVVLCFAGIGSLVTLKLQVAKYLMNKK